MAGDAAVDAALALGLALVDAGQDDGGGLTWHAQRLVDVVDGEAVIARGDVGATLYDGSAGIALALAACAGAAASSPQAEALSAAARGAARHALAAGDELLAAGRLSLFSGATGVALAAAHVAQALHDAALGKQAGQLAAGVAEQVTRGPREAELDVIGGAAGVALGLVGVSAALRSPPPIAALAALRGTLVAAAVRQTWGAAWTTGAAAPGGPPLLGLGHGAAGIALALAESADGDARALAACAEGLEHERAWYDHQRVCWPDLREPPAPGEPAAWMAAWCHGAIGIGLSRLRLAHVLDDARLRAEASAALQAARDLVVSTGTALRAGTPADCTACHGLAGVVELLLVAAQALGVPAHAGAARRVADLMLEERGWPLPGPAACRGPARCPA